MVDGALEKETVQRTKRMVFCVVQVQVLEVQSSSYSPNYKEKQAHSSHRGTKKSTCAAFALANLLQKANSGSSWRLSSEQVGGTECSFVYHVPGP